MISIAPMVDISNHHFRAFIRLLTKKAILYTEMKSADAILHNHRKFLPFHQSQHPIILQIGGCEPAKLREAAIIGEQYGYDGINFNVGCPSSKVQDGQFGAILMKSPCIVRQCMAQMAKETKIPLSLKCRLGVDNLDSYEFLSNFIRIVSDVQSMTPINRFIIHARKAILHGLKPSENLTIPPLDYSKVYQLKQDFPYLSIQINGGIKSIREGRRIMNHHNLQGFMVGRLAIDNPYELTKIDEIQTAQVQKSQQAIKQQRKRIMLEYIDYIQQLQRGQVKDKQGNVILSATMFTLIKPFINFYFGQMNARSFRRQLSDLSKIKPDNFTEVLRDLVLQMSEQKEAEAQQN